MFWMMNDWNRRMGPRGPMGGYRRPVRMYYRPMGFFPMGGLFILPALMFGGWIVLAVLGGVVSLIGSILGGMLEGLSSLAAGAFSGSGLLLGIIIGLAAYYVFKKRNTERKE